MTKVLDGSNEQVILELARRLGVKVQIENNEEEEEVKVLAPFDPAEEIREGRFVWDEELQLGKLTRLYQEPRFDVAGRQFALAVFQDDNVDYVDASLLPDDCFVPTQSQMERWNKRRIGDDWRSEPEKVLAEYGVKLYGDAYGGKIDHVGDRVYLASASRNECGSRYLLVVGREGADFGWGNRWQCGFVPVFFGPEFLAASRCSLERGT